MSEYDGRYIAMTIIVRNQSKWCVMEYTPNTKLYFIYPDGKRDMGMARSALEIEFVPFVTENVPQVDHTEVYFSMVSAEHDCRLFGNY